MNEYAIIAILESHEQTITRSAWPLHLTVLGNFVTRLTEKKLLSIMETTCDGMKPIRIIGSSKQMFGTNNEIAVRKIVPNESILSLHQSLLTIFDDRIELKSPEYSAEGYQPHVTDQKKSNVDENEVVRISNISLVKIEDKIAKILQTIRFENEL